MFLAVSSPLCYRTNSISFLTQLLAILVGKFRAHLLKCRMSREEEENAAELKIGDGNAVLLLDIVPQ